MCTTVRQQKYHQRAPQHDRFVVEPLEHRYLLAVGAFDHAADVGSPALAGAAAYADGVYTITGGGSDIGGAADQFHFAFDQAGDDGSIVARVASLTNTNSLAKAGVMIRNGLDASAAFAGIFVTPSNTVSFLARGSDGGTASSTNTIGTLPRFVKLTRAGERVSAYRSADGITWTQLGTTQTIGFSGDPLLGLAVTSRNPATLTTATVTNVSLLLPSGWEAADVGSPAPPGWAAFHPAANRFTVTGGGLDIGATSDQFGFAYQSFTGDGEVVALVEGLSGDSTKAGVMFRDELAAGSAFASVAATAEGELVFQWRSTAGASAGSATIANIDGPVWIRLSRADDVFSAYYATSAAPGGWLQVGGGQPVAMSTSTALVGLAVTSRNAAGLGEAQFSSVSVVPTGWVTRDIGGPALGGSALYDAPSNSHRATGAGTGIGGVADQFGFTHRTVKGDGAAVAYVGSIENNGAAARAGVMMRQSESPDAPFAGAFVSPQDGVVFAWRTTAGAGVQQSSVAGIAAPVSLRITRTGDTFRAAYSSNGVNWLPVGASRTIAMPATLLAGVAVASGGASVPATATFTGTAAGAALPAGAGIYSPADELFLNDLSRRSVDFFFSETNPSTGMVPDGSNANGGSAAPVSSIAATGFGLSALTIGDRRGWLTHAEAYERALNTVNFLKNNGAQVQGFFYHFLDPVTGQRAWNSELSSIDTALLMAGVLNVAEYWKGTAVETVAMDVYNRVNWPFMLMPNGQYFGHWTPEDGFGGGYVDFSEAVLLYLLGLGSPTHPAPLSSWTSWPRTPVINYGGYTFVTATTRALFTVQYPQGWFDLRGLVDSTGLNYYVNSQFATLAQRQMFIDLSTTYPHYGPNNWGATAADGPNGYTVWGGPPATGNIDGSVVPTAPGGSLAFTPRYSVDALMHMQQTYGSTVYKKYGFVDAFNPHTGWTSAIVLGLDVGMMLLAAENSRSNFVWEAFGTSAVARQAVASAFPSLAPTLLGVASRKPATGGAAQDLPVDFSGERLSIENRQGGPTQLVLEFGANVIKGPSFAISLTTSSGSPNGTVAGSSTSGSTLTVTLSGAADGETLVANISDLRHHPGSTGGNYTFQLGVLAADANADGAVNLGDFNALAGHFGESVQSPAEGDFNFDGVVNLADFNLLANQFGETLSPGNQDAMVRGMPSSAPPAAARPLFGRARIVGATLDGFADAGADDDDLRPGRLDHPADAVLS